MAETSPDPHDAPRLRCHILDTGHCLASEHHLIQGGQRRQIACHSIVALLHHPRHGWLLWDAGYAPRILEATRPWPFRLYQWATPMRLRPELAVVAQLTRFGLTARDIRTIVLSHFHADHIAGLRDFPLAEIVALDVAYQDVRKRKGLSALMRAFVPALLPDDFERRTRLLNDFRGPVLGSLGCGHDLFGDGSAVLLPLPGHARGQMGLLARTERGRIFFAADSVWLSASYRERRPPHRLTNFFIDDAAAMRRTIDQLHAFAVANPDVTVIPSHCPEAFAAHAETV
jgi:glyoxylase-like metal-dependent hydrolase (beta-lactamase superfamily II)